MSSTHKPLRVAIAGSNDFVRRMNAAVCKKHTFSKHTEVELLTVNLADARTLVLTERPDVLVFDINFQTNYRDSLWLRSFLTNIRERLERNISVILAVTTPERFVYAGDMLFASPDSLEPSGYIDHLLMTPPLGIPSALSLEEQLIDCLTFISERLEQQTSLSAPLPALGDADWVPVMCDPESRNVWMRWLPRYARYINENPLIVGPTGAGKTRLAAALHKLSGRTGAFVSITPRDFSSPELVQAELFGAVAGAYTGAVEKWGLVHKAMGGTLFIDELQSIDLDLQGKLITFIENKSYRRVGEATSHQADVRFVFATNRPLQKLVEEGKLRDDFAYRLERLQITLSPLEHRRLDIAAAICFSTAKILRERSQAMLATSKHNSPVTPHQIMGLTQGGYQALFCSSWPGNLRQLENTMAKLIELADIEQTSLIDRQTATSSIAALLGHSEATASSIFEKSAINAALRAHTETFQSLQEFLFSLSDTVRNAALEACAGDTLAAADLIQDSPQLMELFVSGQTSSEKP